MSSAQRLLQGSITDNIIAEKRGNAGWVTFNDPQRHNAISLEMWQAIPIVLDVFRRDGDIRLVVFTGAGERSFVSGANISQFDSLRTGEALVAAYEEASEAAQLAIYDFEKPTLARIRGYCIGGGLNIALCCDMRVASEDSSFSIPAGRLGLGYRLTAIRNLVNAVGPAQALEIFLTAARFPAAQALDKGLLHRVVAVEALDEAVEAYVQQISANAPLTLSAGKQMIRQLCKLGGDVDVEGMHELVLTCFRSRDYQEGKKAFAEKRAPQFNGT